MTPFSDTSDVSSEWRPTDFEQLTPYGRSMINTLGGWFARTYGSQFSNPKIMFRCSKSGRAKESGNDFVTGYNKALNKEVILRCPYIIDTVASLMSSFVSQRQKRS